MYSVAEAFAVYPVAEAFAVYSVAEASGHATVGDSDSVLHGKCPEIMQRSPQSERTEFRSPSKQGSPWCRGTRVTDTS